MRRQTSRPSTSGRPRSRMTRSGPRQGDLVDGLGPRVRGEHLVPAGGQADPEGLEQRRIVVDDEDLGHGGAQTGAVTQGLARHGEDDPGAPGDVGVDPDEPAVRLDEGLGDGQAEAGPAPAAVLAEHLEDALALLAGDAGTVVAHGDLDPRGRAPRCGPRRHADDAVVGREPLRVLEHVRQDLAHEDVIEVQERQVVRRVDPDAAGRHQAAQRRQRLGDQLVEARRSSAAARAPRPRCGSCRAGWSRAGPGGPPAAR